MWLWDKFHPSVWKLTYAVHLGQSIDQWWGTDFGSCAPFPFKHRRTDLKRSGWSTLIILGVPKYGLIHCIELQYSVLHFSPSQVIENMVFLKDYSTESLILKAGDQAFLDGSHSLECYFRCLCIFFSFKLMPQPYPSLFSACTSEDLFFFFLIEGVQESILGLKITGCKLCWFGYL